MAGHLEAHDFILTIPDSLEIFSSAENVSFTSGYSPFHRERHLKDIRETKRTRKSAVIREAEGEGDKH